MHDSVRPLCPPPDVIVVGGGIAGLTVALAASERGLRVHVVHTPRIGAASRASAGLLAPSLEGLPAALLPAACDARDMYPRYLESLEERVGIRVALDRSGIIELGDDEALRSALLRNTHAILLDARALADLEPMLATHAAAVIHPSDGSVDTVSLMRALEAEVERRKQITITRDLAVSLEAAGGGVLSVRCGGGSVVSAPAVVLAMGAWTDLAGLPSPPPVHPVLGELLTLDCARFRLCVSAPGGYLVPAGDALLVGATSRESGFAARTSPEGRVALRDFAGRVVPELSAAALRDHWCGLRPVSPDGLPIVGADLLTPGLFHASGYSRNGILFAPWAAERLTGAVAGHLGRGECAHDPIPPEFSPHRFESVCAPEADNH